MRRLPYFFMPVVVAEVASPRSGFDDDEVVFLRGELEDIPAFALEHAITRNQHGAFGLGDQVYGLFDILWGGVRAGVGAVLGFVVEIGKT